MVFDSSGSTYANQEQARKAAIKNVIIPLTDKIYGKLNEFLYPYYGSLKLKPMIDELPEAGEITQELSNKLINELRAGILTPKQVFEILYPDMEFEEQEQEPKTNEDYVPG